MMLLDDDDFVLIESFRVPAFTLPVRHTIKPTPKPLRRHHCQRRRPSSASALSSSQQLILRVQARELEWLLSSLRSTLKSLKNELENCYALLAPVEPGSTLVLTTPRHEAVKGTITRVGTRITRAAINLRLKTLPPQILTLSNSANASGAGAGKADDLDGGIYLQPLVDLNTLLSESVDLLTLCVSESAPTTAPTTTSPSSASAAGPTSKRAKVVPSASAADFLSSQLRQLAQNLAEATAILKGAPDPDQRWTSQSVSLSHFAAPRSQSISFYLTVQDASIILYLRALEPADAPMNFGAKLAFAIGTARRLEHDEAEKVFWYVCDQESRPDGSPSDGGSSGGGGSGGGSGGVGGGNGSAGAGAAAARSTGLKRQQTRDKVDVYVREKVKVESADPSLLAMSTKLSALANTLALARRNLAAVMGEDLDV